MRKHAAGTPRPLFLCLLVACCYLPVSGQLRVDLTADKLQGCAPLVVHFASSTSGVPGNASFKWDLGNGNSSFYNIANAIYTDPGVYTVTLTVTSGSQSVTATHTVTVFQRPVPAFSAPATVCLPASVAFLNTSAAGSGTVASTLWDFGDGITQVQTGSAGSISHVYSQAGSPDVSITVTNSSGCTATLRQDNVVKLSPPVLPSFSLDKKVLCLLTDPVQFTNTSTGNGPLTYTWDFGDGNGSTQTSPSYSYGKKGTYTVKLTATSADGCTATDTQVNAISVANYTTSFSAGPACVAVPDSLRDISSPAPDSRAWVIDGVNVGTASPFGWNFASKGVHTIQLTDQFGGCSQTASKTVTVNTGPAIPPFDIDIVGKCGSPALVKLADHTSGAVAWNWLFLSGDNPYANLNALDFNSTGPDTSVTYYTDDNSYIIRLTVTDGTGCSNTVDEPLSIVHPFINIYEPNPGLYQSCDIPLSRTVAIDHPELLQSFVWNFGDGTTSTDPSPTHVFSTPGEYVTTLSWTDKNGCTGTSNQIITTISTPLTPVVSVVADTICANTTAQFIWTAPSTPMIIFYGWDFGDGTGDEFTNEHVYKTPGTYTVRLDMSNGGCQAIVVKTNIITVLPGPTMTYFWSTDCDNNRATARFSANDTQTDSLTWYFGDGDSLATSGAVTQLTHTYPQSGIFDSKLVAFSGQCSVTSYNPVYILVRQQPVITADPGPICPGAVLTVQLADDPNPLSQINFNPDYYTQFQYGDSTNFTGTVNMPNRLIYNGVVDYYLSNFQAGESGLRVITTSPFFGCTDTSNFIPLAIQGVSAGYQMLGNGACYPAPIEFKDTSRVSAGDAITSWLWDFGDGQTSTQSGTVSHSYTQPGNYTVKLTVQDNSGCSSNSSSSVTPVVLNGLTAGFSPSVMALLPDSTVVFDNTSNQYGSAGVVWSWDFGDGSPGSADMSPSHAYAQPGTYTVTLTATNGGCQSVTTATIVVKNLVAAYGKQLTYTSSGSCPPLLVQFTNASSGYSSESWDFGDGIVEDGVANPNHVYTKPGVYAVTLTLVGAGGTTDQLTDSIRVVQPTASLSAAAAAICAGQAAKLNALADSAVSYTWDFGDGGVVTSSADSIKHIYLSGGSYTAKLVVTDSAGCTEAADASLDLQVHAPPSLQIGAAQSFVCLDGSVQLNVQGASAYSWSPAASLDQPAIPNPVASPRVNTVYTVIGTDALGCPNSDSVAIQVILPIQMSAGPDSSAICPGKGVSFQAGGAAVYNWIGQTTGLSDTRTADPVARPVQSTIYTVTGSDAHGCFSDTANLIVTVLPLPSVSAGPDLQVLPGVSVPIDAQGSPDVDSWQWTPSKYLSCADCAQPVCTPDQSETYIVTVKNGEGCVSSDTVVVKLLCEFARVRVPEAFSPNGDGRNDRLVIKGISEVDHLVIFDRWGTEVFERDHFNPADPSSCWDGTYHGHPSDTGVYVYLAEMTCPTGGSFQVKGTVVLVR